ncbi:endonuclease [Bifidobacterium callitrichidarum]|uniref:Endonuclease n=2 Tax=Bifidobacterium callitrichidarum TaxID=2052941 RepID=A0A2U2NCU3_9BIFI|nr:endonuclease [Bifidobacterium callitrichidarum]
MPLPQLDSYAVPMKDYNPDNVNMARKLRRGMTPWERKLWYGFLSSYPIRWQRQKPIGNRIVDFYCAKASLAVELDGGGHYTTKQQQADAARTKELEAAGLTVLRFANNEVDFMFHEVCQRIDSAVREKMR